MADQGSLIQLGSPIPGIPGFIGTRDSPRIRSGPGSPRSTESLPGCPAPQAEDPITEDPNRLLRGPVIGNVPMAPLPIFTLESGPSGFPEAARPRPHQCRTAWIQPQWIPGPLCDGVPGYWGLPGLKVHWPRLPTLPTSRIGGTMIQDHRITAPTKPGAAPPMTERPETDTCLGWELSPSLLISSSFIATTM